MATSMATSPPISSPTVILFFFSPNQGLYLLLLQRPCPCYLLLLLHKYSSYGGLFMAGLGVVNGLLDCMK